MSVVRTGATPVLGKQAAAVVIQPTTACNLDCSYCYLPQRLSRRRMAPAVAAATAESVNTWSEAGGPIEVHWHCGEPLAAGRQHLAALMAPFRGVQHCIQTNATLIDDAWCDFFERHDVRISVSIDPPGPESRRRTRSGEPADSRISTGIAALRRHKIPFSALTVVSDPDPDAAAALLSFFRELGCTRLGVVLDKRLGTHIPPLREHRGRAEAFWLALAEAWTADPTMRVREIDQSLHAVARVLARDAGIPRSIDPLPCITWAGDVVLVAPDLAGFRDPHFGEFASGNVLTDDLDSILAQPAGRTWWLPDYLIAVQNCATSCRYQPFCNGPDPAASYFAHGDLRRGFTTHCRDSVIARAEAICAPLLAHARGSICSSPGRIT